MNPWAAITRPVLRRIERSLLAHSRPLPAPPVFILGPPRAGTTLLYQILTHCFEFAYFCNYAAERSRYPATATWLLRRQIRSYAGEFTNEYGKTAGIAGPSEALDVWRRWFPTDRHYADEGRVSASGAEEMRRTVAAVAGILDAPFLSKDPVHSVRVRALNEIFPNSLFLYMHRDPEATAESMLRIREGRARTGVGDVTTWMHVKPREYDLLVGRPAVEQVAGQAYYCARNARDDMAAVAPDRSFTVPYEALCREPRAQLEGITSFLARHGVSPASRRACPDTFVGPTVSPISESERAAIRECLDRFQRAARL